VILMNSTKHKLFGIALLAGIVCAILVGSVVVHGQATTVVVNADDVVKITKVVNYKDKMGVTHYGAKMNIIVFTGGE